MGDTSDEQKEHFVLVHGSCHGAWCWFKLKPLLEAGGHCVSALDLSASGTNTKVIQEVTTLHDYTMPLLEFMATLPPEEKVVLVGHSYGGMNIAVAMQEFPEKISVAVFLGAFMPDTIHEPSYIIEKSMERFSEAERLDTKFVPCNSENESELIVVSDPEFISTKLYHLCSEEDRELAKILVRPGCLFMKDLQNAKLFNEEGYGSVSRVFVICDKDLVLTEDFQRWMINNNPVVKIIELKGVDHMPMLCDPKQLSGYLLDIAFRCA